jgi:hypothetical protein
MPVAFMAQRGVPLRFLGTTCYTSPLYLNSVISRKGSVMQLTLHIDDVTRTLDLPDDLMEEGEDFFQKMDRDMDQGWQMSRIWIDNPNAVERCQIAANKILDAINAENETLLLLMAGYIKSRRPEVIGVRIDTAGDMTETELLTRS